MQKTGLVGLFFLLKIYEFYSDISTQKKSLGLGFYFFGYLGLDFGLGN